MSILHKFVAVTAASASIMAASPAIASAQTYEASNKCSPVHIVNFKGTGGSTLDASPSDLPDQEQSILVRDILDKFPQDVTYYTVPYPATSGALHSLITPTAEQATTYGNSRVIGTKNAVAHVTEYKNACPSSKFVFTGFSQGSSVAGDVVGMIAEGKIPGVSSQDVLSAMLFADPGRSAQSMSQEANGTYWVPLPSGAKLDNHGEFTDSNLATEGWTGPRGYSFKGLEGRVISLCNPIDIACSSTHGSVLQKVAQFSNDNEAPTPAEYTTAAGGKFFPKDYLKSLVLTPQVVFSLPTGTTLDVMKQVAANDKTLSPNQKSTVNLAVDEIGTIITIFKKEGVFPKGTSDAQIFKFVATKVVGMIAKGDPNVENFVKTILGGIPDLPPTAESSANELFNAVTGFGDNHLSYYSNNSYKVEGMPAIDWATQAMETGITRYLSGEKPLVLGQAAVETTAPSAPATSTPVTSAPSISTPPSPVTSTTSAPVTSTPVTSAPVTSTPANPAPTTTPRTTENPGKDTPSNNQKKELAKTGAAIVAVVASASALLITGLLLLKKVRF